MIYSRFLPYLLVMAVVTYLLRMLPLVIFRKKITNRFINSFLYYMPYSVLGAMTFPAILYSGGHMLSGIVALCAALFLAYKNKSLLAVALTAWVTVIVFELILGYMGW